MLYFEFNNGEASNGGMVNYKLNVNTVKNVSMTTHRIG